MHVWKVNFDSLFSPCLRWKANVRFPWQSGHLFCFELSLCELPQKVKFTIGVIFTLFGVIFTHFVMIFTPFESDFHSVRVFLTLFTLLKSNHFTLFTLREYGRLLRSRMMMMCAHVCVANEKDMVLQRQIWSTFVTVLWCSKTKTTDGIGILIPVRVFWHKISKIYWQLWQFLQIPRLH